MVSADACGCHCRDAASSAGAGTATTVMAARSRCAYDRSVHVPTPALPARPMSRAVRLVTIRRADRGRRRAAAARPSNKRIVAPLLGILSAGTLVAMLAVLTSVSALGVLATDLPDPSDLERLGFAQPTVVYDRDGTVELGRFEQERRRVVTFDEVPRLVLDATTTAEDRTFWDNAGIDLAAVISAVADTASGERERGASTITQQLVRARLLPDDVVAAGSDRYLRKVKEIIQALRLRDTFPGEEGKRRVITAYLNEIFYGHNAYGIAAAASIYFGVSLDELTVAQAALLAGLPKSPTTLDPYRFAQADADGRLVVPSDAEAVVRRDWILRGLATSGRWTQLDKSELAAALEEPVILAGEPPVITRGGHFTWQVRRQLGAILGPDVDLMTGGYRVITTLDWRAQRLAEKWLAATSIAPNLPKKASAALLDQLTEIGRASCRERV